MKTPLLQAVGICKQFGGLQALDQINLEVHQGEIVALIGPNGAGKTTLFNCLTGMYHPDLGEINFNPAGLDRIRVEALKPNLIVEIGMARTFQNIRLFKRMTVLENVMVGLHCRTKAGILSSLLMTRRQQMEEKEILERSFELLKLFKLEPLADSLADNLAYADQRRLEIARAMATDPLLLLLDEPSAGMNPQETWEMDQLIIQINQERNISILLIEHDMKLVMNISHQIFVLDQGRNIAQGTAQEIQMNKAVIKAYLGEEMDVEIT